MAKVSEMIRFTGTPISGTMVLSQEMARMAMPTMVRRTMKSSISIKRKREHDDQDLQRGNGDAADMSR